MNRENGWNGVWRGWHWQFIALVGVGLGALQAVADIWFKYPVTTSMPLAVLLSIYLTVPRTKVNRLANTMAAVLFIFLVDILLQFSLPSTLKSTTASLLEMDAYVLIFGLIMAYVFLRMTKWSDKRRAELEEKKRRDAATKSTGKSEVRVRRHRWKKKPKKRR